MKALAVLLLACITAALGVAPASASGFPPYTSISAVPESDVDTAAAWTGDRVLYVRFMWRVRDTGGIEFSLSTSFEIVDLVTSPGVINLGTKDSPVFHFEVCDSIGAIVLAELVVRDAAGAGGFVCFGPSQSGRNCTEECPGSYWTPISTVALARTAVSHAGVGASILIVKR